MNKDLNMPKSFIHHIKQSIMIFLNIIFKINVEYLLLYLNNSKLSNYM